MQKIKELIPEFKERCNKNDSVSQYIFSEVSQKYDLSPLEKAELIIELGMNGIKIISNEEFTNSKEKEYSFKYSSIINEFNKLDLDEKYACIKYLADMIIDAQDITDKKIKERFWDKVNKLQMQYSYVPVVLIAFLDNADWNGRASLEEVTDRFYSFYMNRLNENKIAEKQDSKFSKKGFSLSQARSHIISIPLKRSFLVNYMFYDKKTDEIIMSPELWKSLSKSDIENIKEKCNSELDKYFKRLEGEYDE